MSSVCGNKFHRNEFNDVSGCVKPHGHHDAHQCHDDNGVTYEWEYDLTCDCEDCNSDDIHDWCIVYKKIDKQ